MAEDARLAMDLGCQEAQDGSAAAICEKCWLTGRPDSRKSRLDCHLAGISRLTRLQVVRLVTPGAPRRPEFLASRAFVAIA